MSQPKTKSTTRKQRPKKTAVIIAAAVTAVILAIAGYTAYDSYLDYQDKQRFETVRQSVSILHKRLQQAAGPGVEWEMDVFCSQGSVKFQEALKGCDLLTGTETSVINDAQASKLIEKYKNIFRNSEEFIFESEGKNPNPVNFPANLERGYDGAIFRERETNMTCSSFFIIGYNLSKEIEDLKQKLQIRFNCSDFSRELYYPEK